MLLSCKCTKWQKLTPCSWLILPGNKSDRGQAIIDTLNQSIEALAGTQVYLDLHLETVPAERQREFIQNYKKLMLGQVN